MIFTKQTKLQTDIPWNAILQLPHWVCLKKYVKVARSLVAIGAVGIRGPTISWSQHMGGGDHLFP